MGIGAVAVADDIDLLQTDFLGVIRGQRQQRLKIILSPEIRVSKTDQLSCEMVGVEQMNQAHQLSLVVEQKKALIGELLAGAGERKGEAYGFSLTAGLA